MAKTTCVILGLVLLALGILGLTGWIPMLTGSQVYVSIGEIILGGLGFIVGVYARSGGRIRQAKQNNQQAKQNSQHANQNYEQQRKDNDQLRKDNDQQRKENDQRREEHYDEQKKEIDRQRKENK
jgi:hypothetical protein